MNLAEFIGTHRDSILTEWEAFARTCAPASANMNVEALRDHADRMLDVIAADLQTPQGPREQAEKSKGNAPSPHPDGLTAAGLHGAGRATSGFAIQETVAEFRALRASVIRLWTREERQLVRTDIEDLIRFNEAIDQSLAESIAAYATWADQSEKVHLGTITEQKQVEQRLRIQERSLAAISEGILITDPRQPDDPIMYANPAFEQMTGYTSQEVLGKNCRFLQGPDTDPAVVAAIRTAVRAGESYSGEILNYRKDGTRFWNHLSISPLYDEVGTLTHFVGVQRDDTERKQLIEELHSERSRLAAAFQQSPAFMAVVRGPEHVFELVNPKYHQLVGDRELLGRSVRDALPEVVEQGVVEVLDRVYESGEPFVANNLSMVLQRRPDGPPEERILNFVYQPLKKVDGSVFGVLAHGVDVTEQAQTQELLRVAEAHYRRLVESATHAIFALDTEGRFIELNSAGERMVQCSAGAVLGRHFSTLMAPRSLDLATAAFDRIISGEVDSADLEAWITLPSGEERLILVTETAIVEDDTIIGAHGIARDITEERARQERMRLLTAALDGLPQGVSITDPDGRFLYTNAAHARILGHDMGAPAPEGPGPFMPDEQARAELIQLVRALPEGGSWSGRIQVRRLNDGKSIPLDAMISRARAGEQALVVTILKDASERLAREEHLRRAERLASVGTLLGGVAHELNNPLHAIRNFAELMLMESRSADDLEALEIMKREADRAARIVSNLQTIARQTQDVGALREAVDLNEVVRHVLRLREYALKTSNIVVHEDLAHDLPPAWADRSQLEQVVLNLVVNAEQAMTAHRSEGRLILRTRPSRAGVSLNIVDDGPGIATEQMDRIFDPFFTTKGPGEGTGLGLSLVHSIIAEHGGDLRVESEAGAGATFSIDLPRAHDAAAARRHAPGAGDPERALRILVVDDEPALRRSLDRYLTRRGHTVEVASDGGEALRLLDAAGEPGYDAILSDLKMPGLNGEQFLNELQRRGSGLDRRLVFLTGDAAGGSAAHLLALKKIPVLLKPISLDEVAHALEQCAGRPR